MYETLSALNSSLFCGLISDIDLEIFAKFNRLRQLTTDMSLVAKALSTSALLQAS